MHGPRRLTDLWVAYFVDMRSVRVRDVGRRSRDEWAQVNEHAELADPLPPDTTMRFSKSLVLRVLRLMRVSTRHQVAFNRAIVAIVEELSARLRGDADRGSLRDVDLLRASAERRESEASVRSDLVEVQLQLTELRAVIGPGEPPEPVVSPAPTVPGHLLASLSPTNRTLSATPDSSSPVPAPGLNVFADWAATTGLAQAARRLTVAMHDAGFDLSLGTVRSGAPRDDRRVPDVLRRISHDRRHDIDLWMLNVNEFPVIGDDLLRPPGMRAYSVGLWYWELPTFPDALVAQMDRVDEIWVATRFVQASFEAATARPVHVVPAIVPELKGSGRTREDFGLRDEEVVFLFTFDVNSMVARKNPGGVIEAFRRAFPPAAASGNRLVIKVLNLAGRPEFASLLRSEVADVNGVLIDEDMAEAELVDLFECADVYVSLHRSEGFGFGIAEAMSLGKPVIATAYSGNLDFATATNSFQVGYRIREITSADHVFNEETRDVYQTGAMWADPDLDQAARWMRLLSSDPKLRTATGEAGRATVRDRYSREGGGRRRDRAPTRHKSADRGHRRLRRPARQDRHNSSLPWIGEHAFATGPAA